MSNYERRTQLAPVALLLAPFTIMIGTIFRVQSSAELIGSTGLVLFTATAHVIVPRFVRDRGNVVQKRLWAAWGGNPAVQKLRWRTGAAGKVSRLHRRVSAMTQIPLPSESEEQSDPIAAEETYEDAVARMRELTRDHGKYPRVYAELVQYSATRNLYGLKPAGLVVAGGVLFAMLVAATLNLAGITSVAWWSVAVSGLGATAIGLIWLFVVTPGFVSLPAERYADALLATAGEPPGPIKTDSTLNE